MPYENFIRKLYTKFYTEIVYEISYEKFMRNFIRNILKFGSFGIFLNFVISLEYTH